jgi:Tol biopolymer transport system component
MSASWSPLKPEFVFTACNQDNKQCGLYLVDTTTNTTRLLSTAAISVWPIIWNPDGSQVAMIDTSDDQHRLFVIDVRSGETDYVERFDTYNWQVPPNSPVANWGVTFPRSSDEETGCFKE